MAVEKVMFSHPHLRIYSFEQLKIHEFQIVIFWESIMWRQIVM